MAQLTSEVVIMNGIRALSQAAGDAGGDDNWDYRTTLSKLRHPLAVAEAAVPARATDNDRDVECGHGGCQLSARQQPDSSGCQRYLRE